MMPQQTALFLALMSLPAIGLKLSLNMGNDYGGVHITENASARNEHYNESPRISMYDSKSRNCNCSCGVARLKGRIVGGERALPHEFPWLAALVREERFYCAASLITPRHLLTAAHCLRGFDTQDITVVLGVHARSSFKMSRNKSIELTTRNIEAVFIHPEFDSMSFNNDIAIIRVGEPVKLSSKISTICLPFRENGSYTAEKAVVVGWGRTAESKPTSDLPLKVDVDVLSKESCAQSGYGQKRLTDNMFCAGYLEGGKDSCQGDSGGPLHIFNKGRSTEIIGIVSWGRGCARRNFPGIYTKVTNYVDFIKQNIDKDCLCRPLQASSVFQ